MKNILLIGLAGVTIYLLYENYQLRNQTAGAAPAISKFTTATAAPVMNMVTQPVTPTPAEIVPSSMLETYDAEVLRKFPWN